MTHVPALDLIIELLDVGSCRNVIAPEKDGIGFNRIIFVFVGSNPKGPGRKQ